MYVCNNDCGNKQLRIMTAENSMMDQLKVSMSPWYAFNMYDSMCQLNILTHQAQCKSCMHANTECYIKHCKYVNAIT